MGHITRSLNKKSLITGLSGEKNPVGKAPPSLILKDNGDAELSLGKKKRGNACKNVDTQCLLTMLLGYSLFPSESGLKKVSVLFLFLFYNLCGDSILTDIAVVE